MKSLLKFKFHSFNIANDVWIGKRLVAASMCSGRQLICSSGGNKGVENRRDVDPFIFVFQKWGISWNPVGLFFAFMVACYWNIFTQERLLGIVLGLGVYLLSLILPNEFFRAFQGLTKTGLVEWYVNQGLKVEKRVRKSPALGTGILLIVISLCLAMHMGDSIVRQDAALVLRTLRGITYPYVALVLLFRGTPAMSDPWLLKDISDAIKTLLKYPQDKPGKSTAIAALGGGFAMFAYFERKRELLRQEGRERENKARERGNQFEKNERQDLSAAEDLAREDADHPDPYVRLGAKDVFSKIVDHRTAHNVHPPVSDILPESLESLAKRAQKASEIHTDGLKLKMSMVSKSDETGRVVDYGRSANSPLEHHLDGGDCAVSWIM